MDKMHTLFAYLGVEKNMLPLSVGILSWKSNRSIRATLETYRLNCLLSLAYDTTLLFQEARPKDIQLAEKYGIKCIALPDNIGIGKGFKRLAEVAETDTILLLEHDWQLVEDEQFTQQHLAAAIDLINSGTHCVRLRHQFKYGFPHYSINRYKGKELAYFDEWIQLYHPHLLDAIHWEPQPHIKWPSLFNKKGDFYSVDSAIGNWTNNPCLYNKEFYIKTVEKFAGEGIDLEKNISYWWARQHFIVAQGRGLFEHKDIDKYQTGLHHKLWKKLKASMRQLAGR